MTNRAARARVRRGQLLLALRERIEAGEAGDVGWWRWYTAHIARSRRDGEKVMKIARGADPEAAAAAERTANRESVAAHRGRQQAAAYSKPNSNADPSEHRATATNVCRDYEADDRVERAL
ncbi:MAG: hypothetical protein NTV56_19290, partial [Alphaproteobacteria bacterium]|nr:hypothetical protein [Alphaproteobacteria bacterium]